MIKLIVAFVTVLLLAPLMAEAQESSQLYAGFDVFTTTSQINGKRLRLPSKELSVCVVYRFLENPKDHTNLIPVQECPQMPVVAQCMEARNADAVFVYQVSGTPRRLVSEMESCLQAGGKWSETYMDAPPHVLTVERISDVKAKLEIVANAYLDVKQEAVKLGTENAQLKAEIAKLKLAAQMSKPKCSSHGGVGKWSKDMQYAVCADGTAE